MNEFLGTRRGASLRTLSAGFAASFLLGGALVGYLAYRYDDRAAPEASAQAGGLAAAGFASDGAAPMPTPSATASQAAVRAVVAQQGGIEQRLAEAEQRLARLDMQSLAAADNASRAESLLIAFAARRAIERGEDLGYLAEQLQLRFGDGRPNAVKAVIEGARGKQTADQLAARLDGLGPQLREPESEPVLDRIGRELGSLFVIRKDGTASPQPLRRLERARYFLQSGRIALAVSEVRQMPGAATPEGRRWIADATRLANALESLDRLEGAALLDRATIRDGAGKAITDPSPIKPAA